MTAEWHSDSLAKGQRGGVVSASDSGSGDRSFDSRSWHVASALEKIFTLTSHSHPNCKLGTQVQARLECFVIMRLRHHALRLSVFKMYWSVGALLACFPKGFNTL
ncbi:hypothetical protein ElyMa_001822200 [Elysia marginata]|uniref:Uncharacterized protein n=1 Tax=Elysia marginata TaxID=1093978 RepID=A0AAV4EIB0_9GAST|nr:hypothetical protein ElyMa_001822200 [Elysia marginata]